MVPVLVAARENILDREAYDNATSFDLNDPDPADPTPPAQSPAVTVPA